jgi:hypothetical protein
MFVTELLHPPEAYRTHMTHGVELVLDRGIIGSRSARSTTRGAHRQARCPSIAA